MVEISAPTNVLHKEEVVGLGNAMVAGAITWGAKDWFLIGMAQSTNAKLGSPPSQKHPRQ